MRAAEIAQASTRVQCAHSKVEASLIVDSTVAARLRGKGSRGKVNLMCRIMFAAVAAAVALRPLPAQQVPGRQLFDFPLGEMAEAPALATAAGGGFWNPATIALREGDRFLFSIAALNSPIEQGVSAELGTAAYQIRPGITAGLSVAMSGVSDLLRTDTDPQSIGSAIPFSSTIVSGILAAERGPTTFGIALRQRTGTVDQTSGRATSVDVGATVDRPHGLPFRAALASFLFAPLTHVERASAVGAVEGYLPVAKGDMRVGLSYQQDDGGGNDGFVYAAGQAGLLDLRGGIARETSFGSSTTRLRLGIGVHYAHYLVGVAREDGTAGLGASYQFLLRTVIPKMSTP
jgi:hypothetical protein